MLYRICVEASSVMRPYGVPIVEFNDVEILNLTFKQLQELVPRLYACYIDSEYGFRGSELRDLIWREALAEYETDGFESILDDAVEEILWLGRYGVLDD